MRVEILFVVALVVAFVALVSKGAGAAAFLGGGFEAAAQLTRDPHDPQNHTHV